MKRLLLICAVALCAIFRVQADWTDAKYADLICDIEAENYPDACLKAIDLHNEGDTCGTYVMAAMLICGDGCQRDYPAAINILLPLASAGDERAQYMLGGFEALRIFQETLKEMAPDRAQEIDDNMHWHQMMSNFRKTGQKSENFKDVFAWLTTPLNEVAWGDIMYWAGIMCIRGDFTTNQDDNGTQWIYRSAAVGFEPARNLIKNFSVKNKD